MKKFDSSNPALGIALAMSLFVGVSACETDEGMRVPPDPGAEAESPIVPEELLREMSAFLRGHPTFAFDALVTYESVQESGQKLRFDLVQSIVVNQPGRLWWKTLRDDGTINTAWFSDGVFTLLKEPENLYGQIDELGTIPEMVDIVMNDYGIVVPFSDLLAAGDEPPFVGDLESSLDAGLAWIDGAWTQHLGLRNDIVDFELWIRADGDPVPLKMAITWRDEEGLPSFVARIRNWRFPGADESQFTFVAPADAERIEVMPTGLADREGF